VRNKDYFKDLKEMVEEREVVNLLGDLISINSVNPLEGTSGKGEKEIAFYIRDFLKKAGINSVLQPVLNDRPNVIGILEGRGKGKNIVLEAHMDTVKVDNMRIEPFSPKIEDGRMFGRGACDDKGSLTAMLLAVKILKEENISLKGNVYLAAVVDEEHRYRGVLHLLNQKFKFDAGIVGEPTGLDILIAHRGCLRWRIVTRGLSVHSSEPQRGKNAIYLMSEVIGAFQKELIPLCEKKSHPLVGPPSMSINIIRGGSEVNIVPDRCFIEIDRRTVPGESETDILKEIDEFLDRLKRKNPLLEVEREKPFLASPPMQIDKNEKIVKALFDSAREMETEVEVKGGRFDSDAGKFVARGIATPVFGPGNIAQAHSEDEWVEINQVVQATRIIAGAIVNYQKMEEV